jgi:hypothetical protein
MGRPLVLGDAVAENQWDLKGSERCGSRNRGSFRVTLNLRR